jgi:glutamyl/glutaminyl-tRNA synthetase
VREAKNTQFSPTPESPIHIGNLWIAMLNYEVAKQSGGKFVVFFDDIPVIPFYGEGRVKQVAEDALSVLDTMGYPPDLVVYGSEMEIIVDGFLKQFGWLSDTEHYNCTMNLYKKDGWSTLAHLSFKQIAGYVVTEYIYGINPVIDGEDIVMWTSLYFNLCEQFNIPSPDMYFIPRVTLNAATTSKSGGAVGVSSMIKHYGVDTIRDAILDGCLVDRDKPISLDNIQMDNPDIRIE